jgi:predicted dehydrogenase
VPGGRVVVGYPSFSPDLPFSANRVQGFTADMERWQVPLAGSIAELLEQVDAVMLESVDGRRHLAEARPVFAAKKPVFIDKPLAADYREAAEIMRLAQSAGCPVFSSSSLRYDANVLAVKEDPELGRVFSCHAYSPATLDATNPGLFWYGVHGVETLYTFMGAGCEAVTCLSAPESDVVVGRWGDGRLGVMHGTRAGDHGYGATVYGAKRTYPVQYSKQVPLYAQLLQRIMPFFRTGVSPVPAEETLEIMAFMQAAILSQEQGRTVALDEVR